MPASAPIVQYYAVNGDLEMSAGKIAAQAAHAASISVIDLLRGDGSRFPAPEYGEWLAAWYRGGMAKIVLRGTEDDLLRLREQGFYAVQDGGKTEVPAGSLTVVCLPPMPKSKARKYVGGMKLL
ncbi:peptidyl-tRNA hydrolase [Paenibacillus flagellatus]|uniref:peptidyl-tRNA hydrolase n=2 Tax=Paenibacillus flagellatus TaxID=2211139 RepID=A0A2V5KBC3_9BACL|nr:peptidyl-tRNA hydrolase [Paenibacillus flagellatus]